MSRTGRPRRWLLGVLTLLSVVTAAQPERPPPRVTVVHPVAREVVEHAVYPGRFQAVRQVEVEPRVSGYVDEVAFAEGQAVAAGDVLFRIDPRPFRAAAAQAEARLARAVAERDLARLELARREKLLERDAVSEDEVDIQRAALAGADADVRAAEAGLEAARLDLEYATLRAPIAGRTSESTVDPGDLVRPGGAAPLTTVVSVSPIHFVFDVPEADWLRYRRDLWVGGGVDGAPAAVQLMGETGFPHAARLDFRDNQLDRDSASLRVRATLANADGALLPGVFGRVRIAASPPYPALLVPDQAVVSDQTRKLVMTVADDGTVAPQLVRLGPLHDGLRVVRSGLDADARVVVEGLLQARMAPRVTFDAPRPASDFAAGAATP